MSRFGNVQRLILLFGSFLDDFSSPKIHRIQTQNLEPKPKTNEPIQSNKFGKTISNGQRWKFKRHTLPVCQKVCLSSTSHGRGRLNDSNGFLVSDPISREIPVRVYLSAKPVEWIQLGHVKSLYIRFILSKISVSSLHFLHHGGTDESWARYTTLNHWMKGSILCKYIISKIPDSDSHHFISMVNSWFSAKVPLYQICCWVLWWVDFLVDYWSLCTCRWKFLMKSSRGGT